MNNKSQKIILIVAAIIIGGLVIWGLNQPKKAEAPANSSQDIVYYYGQECPHCQKVSQFLDENGIAAKVSFSKKEVSHNQENSAELAKRAKECGLNGDEIGVPFLYARGKCLVGDEDVINYFKKEAGM